jgi:hypothetical protein
MAPIDVAIGRSIHLPHCRMHVADRQGTMEPNSSSYLHLTLILTEDDVPWSGDLLPALIAFRAIALTAAQLLLRLAMRRVDRPAVRETDIILGRRLATRQSGIAPGHDV